jgi:hypothetical protein
MRFDVFRLREHVVREYREYVESFVHVLEPRIDGFGRARLAGGELWPEAVLQLNPAYEQGGTLGRLAGRGDILAETARFFGAFGPILEELRTILGKTLDGAGAEAVSKK